MVQSEEYGENVFKALRSELLAKSKVFRNLIFGSLTLEDLDSRSESEAVRRTLLVNSQLVSLCEDIVFVLRKMNFRIRSFNELVHKLLIAFVKAIAGEEVAEKGRELVVDIDVQFFERER